MDKINREVLRMELQISELIRLVAHLNERLQRLEYGETEKIFVQVQHNSKK